MIDAATREAIRLRAGGRCEYCRLRQEESDLTHQIEHIIARQHGGSDDLQNLALACTRCNGHKGPNLAGIDPVSRGLAPLFDPRTNRWVDHFEIEGPRIVGRTATGRATVHVLAMNDERRVARRSESIARGLWP